MAALLYPNGKPLFPSVPGGIPPCSLKFPGLKGPQLDGHLPNLPYFTVLIPLREDETGARIVATAMNVREEESPLFVESLRESEIPPGGDWYPAQPAELGERVILKKQAFQRVFLYPIQVRLDGMGRQVRVAEAIHYSLSKTAHPVPRQRSLKTIADNSVLKEGEWYKIGVNQAGIYRLDHSYFTSLGINPDGINPSTLQIYGNGGGMLPQNIGDYPHDDLVENAIQTVGMGDGSFDPGDYILFYGESPHDWVFDQQLDRFSPSKSLVLRYHLLFPHLQSGIGKAHPKPGFKPQSYPYTNLHPQICFP